MTVGKAIETADKLRPNNGFDRELKILWLRQADAGLRKSVVDKSDTTDFDAALGETDRYANEMQLANENQQEFAAWCRHTYLPRMATKWRY